MVEGADHNAKVRLAGCVKGWTPSPTTFPRSGSVGGRTVAGCTRPRARGNQCYVTTVGPIIDRS